MLSAEQAEVTLQTKNRTLYMFNPRRLVHGQERKYMPGIEKGSSEGLKIKEVKKRESCQGRTRLHGCI